MVAAVYCVIYAVVFVSVELFAHTEWCRFSGANSIHTVLDVSDAVIL